MEEFLSRLKRFSVVLTRRVPGHVHRENLAARGGEA